METLLETYLIGIQHEVNYLEKSRENCHLATERSFHLVHSKGIRKGPEIIHVFS